LLLYLVDPVAASQAHAAGVGKKISLRLGGRSHPVQGPLIEIEMEVVALTEGNFAYDGPMYKGLTGNMGRSAWLRKDGVSVVVVHTREQPLDPAFARTLGIDCTKMRYIAVKSAAHFRSGFEAFAGSIFNVDASALLMHDFRKLTYHRRRKPMFPIEIGPS
jgi:microcystin degradation protein MlrC